MALDPSVRDIMLVARPRICAPLPYRHASNIPRRRPGAGDLVRRAIANLEPLPARAPTCSPGSSPSFESYTFGVSASVGVRSATRTASTPPAWRAARGRATSISRIRAPLARLARATIARRLFSLARRSFPTRTRPEMCTAPSEPSRAGSIAPAPDWPNCSSIDGADDFGPDQSTRAVLSAGGRR